MKPLQIVMTLLEGDHWVEQILREASVHRRGGRIWQASFTAASGGQQWKTTGTDDPAAALAIAKEFEAAARAERAQSGTTDRRQSIRNRRSPGSTGGGLTQQEVAWLLGLSERTVRNIEKTALRKLAQHPQLREVWRQFLSGELAEQAHRLSAPEIQALLGLARSRAERETIRKAVEIVQSLIPHDW